MTAPRPQVTVEPAMCFGRPAVRGVAVAAIVEVVWAGEPVESVAAGCDLTCEQVLVACWFAGTYGVTEHGRLANGTRTRYGRVWRDRWGAWADTHEVAMWHGNYDEVPDPPTKEKA